jgi:hypothetical protein
VIHEQKDQARLIGLLTSGLDYTATTILGKFQNDAAGRSVERVLEKLSKKKATEIMAVELIDVKVEATFF